MSARAARSCVGLLLLGASACSSATSPAAPPSDASGADADEGGFVVPDTGPPLELPDSAAGRVASRLAGCAGLEPGCHSESNSAGLVLGRTPAQDFAQIIGVKSTERPDLARVQPGDVARSWMYLKVLGDREAGVDTPMPLGSNGDPAFAATLAEWIDAGAPNPFGDGGP